MCRVWGVGCRGVGVCGGMWGFGAVWVWGVRVCSVWS